ncbi:MAG TPA: alpha/beta fold hydrolase [Anaeromyxobacteraceae bacterium]|nr:alpha/beta fold hydrolase [Anaeromyxobacteraceae bacterium]
MSDVLLPSSPVVPGREPVRLRVRDRGAGPAVLLLHGGWGYEAYPFDAAIDALAPSRRAIAPDRTGYGGSEPLDLLPRDFHRRMADETVLLLDALGIRTAALWGHSDGAVIAAWVAIRHPARVSALVLEALHFRLAKPSSIPFFEDGVAAPERYGEDVVRALERDHGARFREVVARGGRVWLELIRDGLRTGADLFDGRLGEVRAPVLLLHGAHDPRTEPGELDDARRALPHAELALLEAGHAPHASRRAAADANARAVAFLLRHG